MSQSKSFEKSDMIADRRNNIIEITIVAPSEESAKKIFALIESFTAELLRADLEREWEDK